MIPEFVAKPRDFSKAKIRHIGRVKISFAALAHILKLPKKHKIIGIKEPDFNRLYLSDPVFQIAIEGPEMPTYFEGNEIAFVILEYGPEEARIVGGEK